MTPGPINVPGFTEKPWRILWGSGLCAQVHAGKKTLVPRDFMWRGGIVKDKGTRPLNLAPCPGHRIGLRHSQYASSIGRAAFAGVMPSRLNANSTSNSSSRSASTCSRTDSG